MESEPPAGSQPEPAAKAPRPVSGRQPPGPPGPPPPPPAPPQQLPAYLSTSTPTDAMAVLALVLGLLAVVGGVFCLVPGPVCGIPAVIIGLLSRRRIAFAGGAMGGAGLALAGWICGLAGILVAVIYVGLLLAGALALGDLGYLQS